MICGRNEDKLRKMVASYKNVSYYVVDISAPDQIDRLFEQMARDKIVLDVMFNNAGVVEQFDVLKSKMSSAQIVERINTNLSGGICLVQHFIRQANKSKENLIINITSEIALFPVPVLALYAASKAGFSVYTRALRQQLKSTNFKVIEILPPQVETEMPKQIGNTAMGIDANEFAKRVIASINKGKREFAPGSNVPLLKLFNKFLPDIGIQLIDNMSRKQLQVQ